MARPCDCVARFQRREVSLVTAPSASGAFAGRKRLTHDGSQLHFSAHCPQRALQAQLFEAFKTTRPLHF